MKMAKTRSEFVCQSCGAKSPTWLGKCTECGQFGSLVETLLVSEGTGIVLKDALTPQPLSAIKTADFSRNSSGLLELDRVLGGGIVPGSLILLSGDPGIGKSTLLLEAALSFGNVGRKAEGSREKSGKGKSVLYISGEESLHQIKLRAERLLQNKPGGLNLSLLSETDIEKIVATVESVSPDLLIIDSVQTVYWDKLSGTAGSVGQVRECARLIHEITKRKNIATFLVGHVTKEGVVAGPRVLEHLVDVVLYLEGEKYHNFRILRSVKNRFGTVLEVGVFEMREEGLIDVSNPSSLFLSTRQDGVPGSVILPTIQGRRPILAEVQALVSTSAYSLPKRSSAGVDFRRLELLLAVLTNSLKLPLSRLDVFVNIAGGLKVEEPAADLAIALSIYSATKVKPLRREAAVFGEVGLLGEVREVADGDRRIAEAKKFGLKWEVSPAKVKTLSQAVAAAF